MLFFCFFSLLSPSPSIWSLNEKQRTRETEPAPFTSNVKSIFILKWQKKTSLQASYWCGKVIYTCWYKTRSTQYLFSCQVGGKIKQPKKKTQQMQLSPDAGVTMSVHQTVPLCPPPSCTSAPSASTLPNGQLPFHCKLTVLKQLYNYRCICRTGIFSVGVEQRGHNSRAQREKVSRHGQKKTAAL